MPLQGNLRDFRPTQLLNLINLSGRTGTLAIFEGVPTGEKDANENEKMAPGEQRAHVAFRGGKLVQALLNGQDGDLIAVLNKAGKLSDSQAQMLRTRAKGTGDKALAMRLIGANYVTQNDIINSIRQYTLDVVYNLMSWQDGPFLFKDDELPQGDRIMVPIDLEKVIIEYSRVTEEVKELERHLPNLDMALRFPENPKSKYEGVQLSVEEWRVVSFVNPKNTIRKIAKANNMSDIEIRRVVYGLEQAGLVVLVKPDGEVKPAATRSASASRRKKQQPPVQRDVVSKLIDKLKSI